MRGINKVIVMGHLGHKPEIKKTASGRAYTDLRIATNRPIRQGEDWVEIADWHQVRFWEREAELCAKHLNKGNPVAIEGQLRTDTWLNEEGQKRSRTFISGNKLHMLPSRVETIPAPQKKKQVS